MMRPFLKGAALAGVALALAAAPAAAQQQGGQQWFVPGQGGGGQGGGAQQPRPAQAQPRPAQPPAQPAAPSEPPPPAVAIAPLPQLPPITPSPPPPAPVIGVLDVDQLQARWTPYAGLVNAIRARVNRLRQDQQRERQALDEASRAFVQQRASLNPEQQRQRQAQIENRARDLSAQFAEREREVQTLAQSAEALEQVIRQVLAQVAQARGINLVVRSNHIVLNHPSLDITNDVLAQLMLVPVQVQIPPELPPAPAPAAQAPAPAPRRN